MPSSTWEELATRYSEFAALPVLWAAGDVRPITQDRSRTQAALDATIRTLQSRFPDRWPPSPLQFDQQHVGLLFPGAELQTEIRNPRRSRSAGQLAHSYWVDYPRTGVATMKPCETSMTFAAR